MNVVCGGCIYLNCTCHDWGGYCYCDYCDKNEKNEIRNMDKVVNVAYGQIVNDCDLRDRLDSLDYVAEELNREAYLADNIIQGIVLKLIDRDQYNKYYEVAGKANGLPEGITECCSRLIFEGYVANYYVCYLPYDFTATDVLLTFPIRQYKQYEDPFYDQGPVSKY